MKGCNVCSVAQKLVLWLCYIGLIVILATLFGCSPGRYDLYEENDWFAPINNDEQYSQGLILKYSPPGNTSYIVGQEIYTPNNKELEFLQPKDRPYAAWLYTGIEERSINNPYSQDVTTLKVGMVGPSALGREVQNGFHEIIGDNPANGWEHQLNDEPGILFRQEKQVISIEERVFELDFDSISSYGYEAGNVKSGVFASTVFRIGENLPPTFGNHIIQKGGKTIDLRPDYSFYLFFGGESRGVLRDIFLDGNTDGSSHHVDKENMVANLQLGISIMIMRYRVTYTYVLTTPEFKDRDDTHGYGSINVSYEGLDDALFNQ